MRTFSFLFICCLALGLDLSCKKTSDTIPNVPVNFRISLADPNFVKLNQISGWVYVTGGDKGIVVWRKSISEFMAYDRCCSYKPNDANAKVSVDTTTNLFLNDAGCGSKFLITDGSVQAAPATNPLKHYNATFDGTSIVTITN